MGLCPPLLNEEGIREVSDVYSIPRRCSLGEEGEKFCVDEARVAGAYRQDLSDWCAAIDWSAKIGYGNVRGKIHAWLKAVQLRELVRA